MLDNKNSCIMKNNKKNKKNQFDDVELFGKRELAMMKVRRRWLSFWESIGNFFSVLWDDYPASTTIFLSIVVIVVLCCIFPHSIGIILGVAFALMALFAVSW